MDSVNGEDFFTLSLAYFAAEFGNFHGPWIREFIAGQL